MKRSWERNRGVSKAPTTEWGSSNISAATTAQHGTAISKFRPFNNSNQTAKHTMCIIYAVYPTGMYDYRRTTIVNLSHRILLRWGGTSHFLKHKRNTVNTALYSTVLSPELLSLSALLHTDWLLPDILHSCTVLRNRKILSID